MPRVAGTRVCQPQKANTQKCFWNRLEPLGAAATAALAIAATARRGQFQKYCKKIYRSIFIYICYRLSDIWANSTIFCIEYKFRISKKFLKYSKIVWDFNEPQQEVKSTTCNQPNPVQCTRHTVCLFFSLSRSLSPSFSPSFYLSLSLSSYLSLSLSHCLQLPPANLFEKSFVTFGLALFTLGAPVCPPVWLLDMYRHVDIVHTI